MEDIYNYIAIDLLAPDNAMGQYNRIADEILTLDTFPERFRIMDSEPENRMELRRMLVDNYSVFYTIRDEKEGMWVMGVNWKSHRVDLWEASYKSTRLFEFGSDIVYMAMLNAILVIYLS